MVGAFYTRRKRSRNTDSIKGGNRKAGKVDGAIQCYLAITFHPKTHPRLLGLHFFVSPKNSMSPSNGERVHARDSTAFMASFFNSNKIFHKKYANA